MAEHLNRRPDKALTAQAVKNAAEPGKSFDGHGLYLRVERNGSRFWVQRIVIRGRRSEIGLGSASLVSLAEARAAALDNRKLARSGGASGGTARGAGNPHLRGSRVKGSRSPPADMAEYRSTARISYPRLKPMPSPAWAS